MKILPLLTAALLSPASVPAAETASPGGYWTPDAITGCGLWTAKRSGPDDIASWSGDCVDERAQGPGVLSWFTPDGLLGRYTGSMVAGRAQGLAVLYYRSETGYDRYEGRFDHGRLKGQVVLRRADGDRFEGPFSDGRPFGVITVTRADGSSEQQQWVDGQAPRGKQP